MAYVPNSGSVVAFQSNPSVLQAVVLVTNLQGASISGTVNLGTQSGSVVAFQGTNPWIITGSVQASLTPAANQSVSGTVGASIIGLPTVQTGNASVIVVGQSSIAVAIISGSIAATFTPPANQSVSGTVGASIIGTVPITVTGIGSMITVVQSSVAVAIISGSIAATFTPPANQSVSGTVGASIIGLAPVSATQITNPWIITGSVQGTMSVIGTVPVTQSTNPWVVGSIVGTYSEDVASGAADKGLFTLGIRNDAVASLVGTDLDYTGWSTDSAGRHLVKPFSADESRLDTTSSTVSTSVTALFTSVTGLRNYVTDIMIANTGSVATLVTFKDGSTSILGYTIAPAGGGSNINGMAFPLRTAPAQDFVYVNATASSVLYVTAKGYKGP